MLVFVKQSKLSGTQLILMQKKMGAQNVCLKGRGSIGLTLTTIVENSEINR